MACYNDAFSDISSDEEFVRLTQLMELSLSLVDTAEFADCEISQEDIVFVALVGHHRHYKFTKPTSIPKEERTLHAANDCSRFHPPVSAEDLINVQASRIPKNTSEKALWAVTLFGEWRAMRNMKCIEGGSWHNLFI